MSFILSQILKTIATLIKLAFPKDVHHITVGVDYVKLAYNKKRLFQPEKSKTRCYFVPSMISYLLEEKLTEFVPMHLSSIYYIHEANQKGFISASAISGGCAFFISHPYQGGIYHVQQPALHYPRHCQSSVPRTLCDPLGLHRSDAR